MKLSDRIAERLKDLGWEVLDQPRRNPYWTCSGYRAAGTSCWFTRILKRDEWGQVICVCDLYCWNTMREMLRVEKWSFVQSQSMAPDHHLYPVYPK